MCGIAGFVSNTSWQIDSDLQWVDELLNDLENCCSHPKSFEQLARPIEILMWRFEDMMSFDLHYELIQSEVFRGKLERLSGALEQIQGKFAELASSGDSVDIIDKISQDIKDCLWQIRYEILENVDRSIDLLDDNFLSPTSNRAQRFAAWSIERVLENIDRLEVRGRDSAGISIQFLVSNRNLEQGIFSEDNNFKLLFEKVDDGVKSSAHAIELPDKRMIVTFVYKVANLVGRLGDNTAAIRRAIRQDSTLWSTSSWLDQINILAHTRWASNGIISLPNCHPTDGRLYERDHQETLSDKFALFVLNGDVDNYSDLVASYVLANGFRIDPTVTTDAKILPVFYRLGTNPEERPEKRFADLMNSCSGSLAVVMQHPYWPNHLFLAQKGSGQSLFVGKTREGYALASEVYGLAALTRRCFSLVGSEKGGSEVVIFSEHSSDDLTARFLSDGEMLSIKSEPIYIHSRDIYRGSYDYYFEKEIHEAPTSIKKTIKNKYKKTEDKIEFVTSGAGSLGPLIDRLRDSEQPIRRITVIGQGTASIAAQGVAYLIEKAIEKTKIIVTSCKASELSGFLPEQSLSDMLLIAISQSGTTTDTNRTVDIASSRGAWVHSIVNRRNSPLVAKSNSYFYTSDGRDVEMAVASTKAFYSQIAAGKLTALVLGQEFRTLSVQQMYHELESLESLPSKLEWVLNRGQLIKDIAEKTGPSSRNWAVVGNGPNKIAADEIRIKLSELCYKSIPCDFTEDKKHIDLSTEPLTIVVANDLPDQIVQDTAKEVAIFRAHSGKPIVLCSADETRFTGYADSLIELPHVGAGLDFVPATAAGHLWGFYTARAIDSRADYLRNCRSLLTKFLDEPLSWDKELLVDQIRIILKLIADGEMNAALPASAVALLSMYMLDLICVGCEPRLSLGVLERGITVLTRAIEEMTRPIDSIRHQAKTVTVGISRPLESLPPVFLNALEKLQVSPSSVRDLDRPALRAMASVIDQIVGGILYEFKDKSSRLACLSETDHPMIQVTRRFGFCEGKGSRYDQPRRAGGSKRTALRLGRMVLSSGRAGLENLLVIPLLEQKTQGCGAIVLFHLTFIEKASLQQKLSLLKSLGVRYDEIVERLEEIASPQPLETFVEQISPRDLTLAPLDTVILTKSK